LGTASEVRSPMDMTAIWIFCLIPFTLLSLPFIYESLLPSQVPEPRAEVALPQIGEDGDDAGPR
jgi:hypothetical protein